MGQGLSLTNRSRLRGTALLGWVLLACLPTDAVSDRNYDPAVLALGQTLYRSNCSACHGVNAEGTVKDWHIPDKDGRYPPPPLNGSAHTWHHSLPNLMNTVRNGTQDAGGGMPGWKETLSDDEIFHILVWLTSLWPDEIYDTWLNAQQQ